MIAIPKIVDSSYPASRSFVDIAGRRYGRLTVVSYAGKDASRNEYWNCICDCGNESIVRYSHLSSGATVSCSNNKECYPGYIHGHTTHTDHSATYKSWKNMMQRCYNANSQSYPWYGAKGITVCERWHDFSNFLSDVGERPSPKHSLDKINNRESYSPDNCRWATRSQQDRNKTTSRFITAFGKTATISEWSEVTGISRSTISHRIFVSGMDAETALTKKAVAG